MNEQYAVRELLKAKDILMDSIEIGEKERIKLLYIISDLAAELDLSALYKMTPKTTII